MRKIIAIGECVLDVLFRNDHPVASFPGGRLLNAAAMLGSEGHQVYFVGEAARDHVGDIIVDYLSSKGVNVQSIDRFTDGITPTSLVFIGDNSKTSIRHERYPAESFDVVWPRIDSDDIVIFGTFYSLEERVRTRLFEIVKYAAERGAIIIYLPGFSPELANHITRVKPAILENFEVADIVISRSRDLQTIFGDDNDDSCYNNHMRFYCYNMLNADKDACRLRLYARDKKQEIAFSLSDNPLIWNAGIIAGLVNYIAANGLSRNDILNLTSDDISGILSEASKWSKKTPFDNIPTKI